jgi:hypothetical protein
MTDETPESIDPNLDDYADEPWNEETSNLCQHAKRELKMAGLFDEDSDYDGRLGKAAYDIIKTFAQQGHSGNSAMMVTSIVTELMQFKPLTPIGPKDEWNNVSEAHGHPMWQSKRSPSVFSENAGKTWYDINYSNNG